MISLQNSRKKTLPRYNPRLQKDRLIVFGRYPIPGRTKTRLIPALHPVGAADLQRRLTEITLQRVRTIAFQRNIGVEVCFQGGSLKRMRRWLGSDLIFSHQGPGDLGQRMYLAFIRAFQEGCRRVVLLGTDIPELSAGHIGQAFDALSEHDLVLGPSTDGGYCLMGLTRPADLFHGISWSTSTVHDHTIALANKLGLRFHRLDSLDDIDTFDDLKLWKPDKDYQRPYISVIIPTWNEESNIERAVGEAQNEETEVIVVDGGSEDGTRRRANRMGARVVRSSRGRAKQQNAGAATAFGRILFFLHADTQLPKDYVGHIFEALMDPGITIGAFRFKTDLNHPSMRLIELLTNFRSRNLKLPYGDQGLFMRKSVFESVGGFPEIQLAEDLFFVRRLAKLGRIEISPVEAITSARRWRTFGLLRTTLINQLIVIGCYLGLSPRALASLYRFLETVHRKNNI